MYAKLHPHAQREFITHALFYERQQAGLGSRFIDEIERGIELLLSHPQLGPEFDDEIRCFVLDDFPFSLLYRIEPDRIWIIAVAHQRRQPNYWRARLEP